MRARAKHVREYLARTAPIPSTRSAVSMWIDLSWANIRLRCRGMRWWRTGFVKPLVWRRMRRTCCADVPILLWPSERQAITLALSGRTLELYRRRYESLPHPSLRACAVGHVTDLRYAGRLDDARELGEQTVRQYRETLGENHPFTLAAIANYAVLQRITGDVAGARELNDRTLRKFQGALGADHPHAIACGINLGSDRAALGEID